MRWRTRRLALLLALPLAGGCAAMTERSVGLTADGDLTPCPAWPRCVSSQAEDADKQVPPLTLRSDADAAWTAARAAVAAMPRTTLVEISPGYMRAEVVSPWHVYTDDLELRLRPEAEVIHVRSSARIGYYDFEVNRERVESLRDALTTAGVVAR